MELKEYFERQLNLCLWLLVICLDAFLIGELAKLLKLWIMARPIPGPPCHSFLYGHYRLISRTNFTDFIYKCHEKYGSVVKLWLGPTRLFVSVKDAELIKEVLLKAEDKLPLTGKAFSWAFGRSSLFISSFDKVEHRRKSLEVEFSGTLLERISSIPGVVLDCILERAHSVMGKGGLDCDTFSQHLAFTILGTTLFGDVFLTWPKATIYEELLMKIAKDAYFWASYGVTPFWKPEFWRYRDSCTKLKCLTEELIEECRKSSKSGFLWDFGAHQDMGYEPCGDIISLMFHGSLNMAALIGNMLTRLVTHLDLQDKIHTEIIMAQNVLRRPDQHAIDRMPHLLATLFESARLLPDGPLLQRCSLRHDLHLRNSIVIPAGAIIVLPLQLIQMDSSNWGNDADKFNPCHFLPRPGDRCKPNDKVSLTAAGPGPAVMKEPFEFDTSLPFGSGARACIGQKLAVFGISSLFEALLGRYEVKLLPRSESNTKLTMINCVQQLLPSPKIFFVKRSN